MKAAKVFKAAITIFKFPLKLSATASKFLYFSACILSMWLISMKAAKVFKAAITIFKFPLKLSATASKFLYFGACILSI